MESDRYAKHGRWVGLYSAISFIALFLIGYIFQYLIYKSLSSYCSKGGYATLDCTAGDSVGLAALNVRFGKLIWWQLTLSAFTVLAVAALVGFFVAKFWNANRKFLIPIGLYPLLPLGTLIVTSRTGWNFMGMWFVAFFYATLIYIMRFAIRFNPHLQVKQPYPKGVMLNIFKIYHQYVLLSLAVIGLSLTTFIFGFEALVRDFWDPAWKDFPQIRGPIYASHALFLGVGLIGLVLGFVRQFHVKQEEVLKKGFDSPERFKRIQSARPRSGRI